MATGRSLPAKPPFHPRPSAIFAAFRRARRGRARRVFCRAGLSQPHALMLLSALLAPASVAVLGASERPSAGRGIVESLQRIGFGGDIWPVNPRYPAVAGLRGHARPSAL